MTFRLPLCMLAGAMLLVSRAQADPALSPAYGKCIERAGAADPVVMECIETEFKLQDRRLNAGYRKLLGQLPAVRRQQLQDAQRAWVKFAEANCAFYFDPEGGAAARTAAAECAATARASRAKELEDLAS
jgi:uncharacterized protein YecT (DUF1311 family)